MLSALLDVAIGLILLYVLLSSMASALSEIVSNFFQWRSAYMVRFLERLLVDPALVQDFFTDTSLALHMNLEEEAAPAGSSSGVIQRVRTGISGWYARRAMLRERPAYIKAEDFAQAVFDLMKTWRDQDAVQSSEPISPDQWKALLNNQRMPAPLRTVLSSALTKAETGVKEAEVDIDKFRKNLEDWYDRSMDRVSGWYKRRTQFTLFCIGLVVSVVFNLDTIGIANKLLQNPALREAIVAQAQITANRAISLLPTATPTAIVTPAMGNGIGLATPDAAATLVPGNTTGTAASAASSAAVNIAQNVDVVKSLQDELNQLSFPMGWPDPTMPDPSAGFPWGWWARKALGLLITTLAVLQGAPFWFDLLNKVTNLRSSGKPPERAGESS